jgi:hypothetical protein
MSEFARHDKQGTPDEPGSAERRKQARLQEDEARGKKAVEAMEGDFPIEVSDEGGMLEKGMPAP